MQEPNIAKIPVAGVAGLGMVVVAAAVAASIPEIGTSIAAGLILGVLFAVVLIRRRRAAGPMPSSGQRPGANTTLAIDAPDDPVAPVEPAEDQHDARLATVRA